MPNTIRRLALLSISGPLALCPAFLGGCGTSHQAAEEPIIWAGAVQDQNYEIRGKPEEGGGQQSGYGFDQKGGELDAEDLEQQALNAPQVHYHVHHHYHYGTPAVPVVTGYAQPNYSAQIHHHLPTYVSPYAHSPNGGNPVGPQGNGPWNWHPGFGPYGGYGGWGGYNPWIHNGGGGLQGVGE